MASISGDFVWKAIGQPNISPNANVLYDSSTTGFIFQKTNYSTTAPNTFTPSGGTGVILNANPNRILFYTQTLDITSPLFVKLGTGASNASFNYVLKKNTAQNAGDGGELTNRDWKGTVSVSGVNTNFIAWELI